ncbi:MULTISPECIES: cytochrome P450 [Mycobacterium]|uniref:cytochrome P450 n=1 Tax=Mycobacterium TaxID=1763 RepID=UPI00200FA8E0|nr:MULTISPECIES: cytochrome P450 [Mycobacterium]UQB93101.1 cytochrome P450 [Mycobacterium intracellulare]WSE46182.1 cytochrome P450 [Mycobacterium sp. 3-98]
MVVGTAPRVADVLDVTSSEDYARYGHPWASFDLLRRQAPVFWYERPGFEPFWAITRHDDITMISKSPEIFSSAQRIRIEDVDAVDAENDFREARSKQTGCSFGAPMNMMSMDPPVHRSVRRVASQHFTPRAVARHGSVFRALAERYAEDLLRTLVDADGQPRNFVREFAQRLPLFAICSLAGVPEADWPRVLHWIGARVDPAERAYAIGDLQPEEVRQVNLREFDEYFLDLVASRRREPRDDLITELVSGQINGEQLSDRELLDYLLFLISAGNETTRSATTMGVEALLQNPDQLNRFLEGPAELSASMVDEIIRWSSVFIHFKRTCLEKVEIRGREILPGETVAMFYPSANRDEDVFADPYTFDITRAPNPHLGFGRGEHHCLGVNLARAEMRALFEALAPILPSLELAGPLERVPNRLDVLMARDLPVRLRQSAGRGLDA